ncbi:Outer membrane receptor proteins, mostly Fe transport [Sphingopyxis sp. YR583]|uniref:TonB-dependent receptor n=1 Tax=Sphingopyxis sp. YR583 TaxID=1881047 RepID=UPI0008A75D94|nr:TonB-dependent receptor [Sphingopyxis sp. YR583]SEH19145.1 Outer membrane receptor proteins, mostly Fe transport [Sphingopyxis sp. YR583]
MKSSFESVLLGHVSRATLLLAIAALPVQVLAQTADITEGDGAGYRDEIIVTATKRSASIQDVPLSVAAIEGAAIENQGIDNVADIARLTPGVAVSTTGPGRTQIIVRGISSTTGSQATTGFYLDEVPVSAVATNIEGSTFDLNRVEVLRGPQGTLYGSASMGGAIKYVSNQPDTDELEARGDLTLSSTKSGGTNYAANAVVNLPLIKDVAALRVVGFYKFEDGYIDRYAVDPNNYLAIDPTVAPKKNVNSYDIWGFRAALAITPTDTLRITPSVYYQNQKVDGAFAFDDPPGSYDNMVQARMIPDRSQDEVQIYNLTAAQEIGDLELTSSSSYFIRDFKDTEDTTRVIHYLLGLIAPGVQTTAFPHGETQFIRTTIFTQEVRLSGEIGPIEFVVGGYYQENKRKRRNELPLTAAFNDAFGTPFTGFDTLFRGRRNTAAEEVAAFGQATWNISDRLRVTGGLRWFEVKEDFNSASDGVFNGGPTQSAGTSKSSGVTPKFGVDFDVTDNVLLYASASKGFRAGGALAPVPIAVCAPYLTELGLSGAPTKYDPDSLWSYEIGAKTQFADRRVTMNASAYHIDWSRIQQQVSLQCGFNFTGNFGKAVSRGLELETNWRASDSLTLGLNLGYNDAKLKDTVAGTTGQAGDRLLDVPKFTASASFNYDQPIGNGLNAFLLGNASHTSSVLAEYNDASPWRTRKSYQIVDLRLGVHDEDERWRVSLFVDNLLNTHATVGNAFSSTAITTPTTRSLAVNRPRTVGVNLKTAF